ncbi:MAG: hypothetical protein WC449_05950 [Candidatus Paceibacterota bacterium]
MNVLTTPASQRSSDADLATTVIAELDKALEVQKDDFDRGVKAWRRYFPINYGKWDPEALKVLQEEYRQPVQIDISSPRVDTLAGSLVSDLPDPTWIPVKGQKSLLTESIAQTWYTDRDLYNYETTMLLIFRDGLVHCGDLGFVEDYKFHTPRIKLERIMHGFLVWEPYWLSDDDRDAEVVYRVGYLNPAKIVRKYHHKTDELNKAIAEYKRDKSGYPTDIEEQQKNKTLGKVGDEFQVIEKHYLEHIKTTRLIGRREGQEELIPFPINKEQAYLEAFADVNQIDWTTVFTDTYEDKISYVTTVCRELPTVAIQAEAKNKVQVNGLPYHHFTARRWAGKNMGIQASIDDVEDIINKRESMINEHISKASGGSDLVNENLFPDPQKRQNWVKNKNKSGHAEFVDLDSVKNVIQKIVPTQHSISAQDQISRMYEQVLPLVSRVSEALASMSESTDSGILFERKFQMNMIANTLMNRNIRQFINNVAESYFYQWQITYAGYEHEVVFRDGKTALKLNQRRGNQTFNDVSTVPRCRVVTAENTKSQTYQMRWRSVWAEMLEKIDPNVGNGIALPYWLAALKNFFETIDKKDEDREGLKVIDDMMAMISRLRLISEATTLQTGIQGNTLQSAQIDMQMQAILQQMQVMQKQPAAIGHTEPSTDIQYPENNQSNINPQGTEEVSAGMPTQPELTGVSQ